MDLQGLLAILFATPIGLTLIIWIQATNPLSDQKWDYPQLNKFSFNLKQPIIFFTFCSLCSISHGVGAIIGIAFSGLPIHAEFFISLVIGIGLLIGVCLCLLIFKKKFQ